MSHRGGGEPPGTLRKELRSPPVPDARNSMSVVLVDVQPSRSAAHHEATGRTQSPCRRARARCHTGSPLARGLRAPRWHRSIGWAGALRLARLGVTERVDDVPFWRQIAGDYLKSARRLRSRTRRPSGPKSVRSTSTICWSGGGELHIEDVQDQSQLAAVAVGVRWRDALSAPRPAT